MDKTANPADFEEHVRARAYALWESEGRPSGRDAEHWRVSEAAARREFTPVAPAKPKPEPKAAAKKKAVSNKRTAAFAEAVSFA